MVPVSVCVTWGRAAWWLPFTGQDRAWAVDKPLLLGRGRWRKPCVWLYLRHTPCSLARRGA